MGMFNGLMGGEKLPPLPETSYAIGRLKKVEDELQRLASDTKERIEVVPAARSAYVFIGKPPRKFGMAWITDGEITNLGETARHKNLSPITLERLEDEIKEAYQRSETEQRYACAVGGRIVIVTPSEHLESELQRIIQALLN